MDIWDEVIQEITNEIQKLRIHLGNGTAEGGILLPDSTKEDMSYLTTVGRVVALGDLAYMDKDKFPAGAWCNVGDHVCYGKHTGTKLFYKGVRFILLFDDQITMKVEDPKDLDPTFNLTKGSA
jgi:co-chaperonin GroES (HSP10)